MQHDSDPATLDGAHDASRPTVRVTRRAFVVGTASSWLLAMAAACSNGESDADPVATTGASTPAAGPTGPAFTQPEELTSTDGVLELVLRAEVTQLPWAGSTRFALTYNGSTPGPTLRVRPGDRLQIRLENRLPEPTNLHTHGLHVSPEGDGDNVFLTVAAGEDHTYTYDIPADHRSGTFWYHPHAHGAVARQVFGGLVGAIVVADAVDDSPALAGSNERLLVVADQRIGAGAEILGTDHMDEMIGREGNAVLINGSSAPEIPAVAGELERWRLLNASASRYYRLAVEGHDLHVIATDGGRIPTPVKVSDVLLAPGERTEVLIAPTTAGSYALQALPYDRAGMGMAMGGADDGAGVALATMNVSGDADAPELPSSLPVDEAVVGDPTNNRTLELGQGMAPGGGMAFTIDGKMFDHERTDIEVASGTIEQWQIVNTTAMDHPFHLHVWPFRVVDDNAISGWKDTVNVPAGSSVQIAVPFGDTVGRTVYHCHVVDHEDFGMMGVIEVT